MREHWTIALRTTLVLLVLVSAVYPGIVWGIGQLAFREQANGSLIGQGFSSDRYFHSRPSAVDYNGASSGGSNLGPTSRKLAERIARERRGSFAALRMTDVPADAVTASGSGLDPHISPAYALLQVPRVARARGLEENRVRALVEQRVEGRFLGVYGEPRVNVLLLNLALDAMMDDDAPRTRADASRSR